MPGISRCSGLASVACSLMVRVSAPTCGSMVVRAACAVGPLAGAGAPLGAQEWLWANPPGGGKWGDRAGSGLVVERDRGAAGSPGGARLEEDLGHPTADLGRHRDLVDGGQR